MPYAPHVWVIGGQPAINDVHLNEMEAGIAAAPYGPDGSSGFVPVGNGSGAWVYKKITDTEVAAAAAIAYSKLALTGSIVNADISPSAAIAATKLDIPSFLPPGCIFPYAATGAPTGYLSCDGAAVSRGTYAALFSSIGTTYGVGDGSTTFNVPDLRGRVIVGYAPSGGHSDVAAVGNNEGVAVGNRRPKHNSTVNDPTHSHELTINSGNGAVPYQQGFSAGTTTTPGAAAATGITVGPGGTAPIDTPAYIVVNYIIKT